MQRRELLERMISTAMAMGLISSGSLAAANTAGSGSASPAGTARWLESGLRQLAAKDSSEQGVPMLLALENLANSPAPAMAESAMNRELVAKFERYADLLLQYKSAPDENDAVALVVLMAAEDLLPETMALCR